MPWTNVREDKEQYKFRNVNGATVVAVTEEINNTGNAVQIIKTTVTTTATQIEMPEGIVSFSVFHQTSGSVLYYNEASTVDSTDPHLKVNDTLKITGARDFELWMKSDSEDVIVYVLSTAKV